MRANGSYGISETDLTIVHRHGHAQSVLLGERQLPRVLSYRVEQITGDEATVSITLVVGRVRLIDSAEVNA